MFGLAKNDYKDGIPPERIYEGGGRHGVKVTDKDAQIEANKYDGKSYGRWGNKKDLAYAREQIKGTEPGFMIDIPVNFDSKSVVFHNGGDKENPTTYKATHYRVKINKDGRTFHGFPIDETAGPIISKKMTNEF